MTALVADISIASIFIYIFLKVKEHMEMPSPEEPTIEMLASNAVVTNRTSCIKPSFQMLLDNNITILPSGKFGGAAHVKSG